MFGRRKRKINNAATGTFPPLEGRTTIQQAAPNYAWPIAVAAAFVLLVLRLTWGFIVYAFDVLGYSNPERVSIKFLAWMIGGIIAILLLFLLAQFFFNRLFEHLETMKDKEIDLAERQLRLAANIPADATTQMTNEVRMKAKLIRAVIYRALFNWSIDDDGKLCTKHQPWSRRKAMELTIDGEHPTEVIAQSVATWLMENNFLLNDRQLNLPAYGGNREKMLQAVTERILNDFGRPIQFNVNDTLRDNRGFEHVKNAN